MRHPPIGEPLVVVPLPRGGPRGRTTTAGEPLPISPLVVVPLPRGGPRGRATTAGEPLPISPLVVVPLPRGGPRGRTTTAGEPLPSLSKSQKQLRMLLILRRNWIIVSRQQLGRRFPAAPRSLGVRGVVLGSSRSLGACVELSDRRSPSAVVGAVASSLEAVAVARRSRRRCLRAALALLAPAQSCRRSRGGVALGRRSPAAAARFSARASNSAAGAL